MSTRSLLRIHSLSASMSEQRFFLFKKKVFIATYRAPDPLPQADMIHHFLQF